MPSLHPSRLRKLATLTLLALFFSMIAIFLGPNIVEHRDESLVWYVLHISGGSLVLILGPLQFIAGVRNRFRRYHRAAGYTYVLGSGMAVIGYVGLPKNELFLASQLVALTLWSLSVFFAILAIRSRKLLSHQHNMTRSFVLACYFLTSRLLDRYGMGLLYPLALSEPVKLAHSDWLAWVLPLAVVELYFNFRWQATLRGIKRTQGEV